MFAIETVDYHDPDAPAAFTRSLRETGFAVLSNHPITPDQIAEAYAGWRAFFNSDEKGDFTRKPGEHFGYYPFRSENAKGATEKDLKEFFQVYPRVPLPASVETLTRKLYDDLHTLGTKLLGWIEDNTPDAVRGTFSEPLPDMLRGSEQSMLRILHYPSQDEPAPKGATRAAAHEDINLITLLVAGSAPGLEAQDTAGNWHAVPCDPGMIAVNVGDMLQMASGGYFPSTTHRVVNPEAGDRSARLSMPMFVHPRSEVMLDKDKSANEYLAERLREIGVA